MHAIVIGGGLVGASAAYRLARSGAQVTLVDRADQGQATAAGAGIICPGTSFKPPAAWFPLAFRAVGFYPDLMAQLAEDGEEETGYAVCGELFVATDDQEAARLPELLALVRERAAAGVSHIGTISPVDSQQARELFPALAEVPAAFHCSGAARVDGRLLRDALRRAATRRGAQLVTGNARLVRQGERVTAVQVGDQHIAADAVVIAGGAWTPALGEVLGVRLPVYPQRGQILHLGLPEVNTGHWPIVVGFHSHYILTFPTNRLVAGATREDGAGFDYRLTAGGVHEALGEALRIAPGLSGATVNEVRIGFRPASPDGVPVLGRAPGLNNVLLATGHGATGLQLGPYSGAAVADQLLGRSADLDLAPFDPGRFH